MNAVQSITPKLIENGVKEYVQIVLNKCNQHRVQIYSIGLNVLVLILFVTIVVSVLWYCHSHKLTPQERLHKFRRDQEYVLTKIREFQIEKNQQKEQFSQLLNRVSTSQPIGSSTPIGGAPYKDDLDPDDLVNQTPGMPFSSMIPGAPNQPSYRDLIYHEVLEKY